MASATMITRKQENSLDGFTINTAEEIIPIEKANCAKVSGHSTFGIGRPQLNEPDITKIKIPTGEDIKIQSQRKTFNERRVILKHANNIKKQSQGPTCHP
jgi:hypothetical protein